MTTMSICSFLSNSGSNSRFWISAISQVPVLTLRCDSGATADVAISKLGVSGRSQEVRWGREVYEWSKRRFVEVCCASLFALPRALPRSGRAVGSWGHHGQPTGHLHLEIRMVYTSSDHMCARNFYSILVQYTPCSNVPIACSVQCSAVSEFQSNAKRSVIEISMWLMASEVFTVGCETLRVSDVGVPFLGAAWSHNCRFTIREAVESSWIFLKLKIKLTKPTLNGQQKEIH